MTVVDILLAVLAVGVALWLRPWRAVGPSGPPWPWLAWCAVLPMVWGVDHYVGSVVVQPLSGATLLMLLAGWPLAVLALLPVALVTAVLAHLEWLEALHRYVWLGLVPATAALAIGAALRRWLPHHLFIYILGRGFFGTVLSSVLASWLSLWLHGGPAGVDVGEAMVARWLAAWGDGFLAGMLVAIFVAFRPEWLATYADRIYLLPPDRR
ncbi:MAG TPA: hypothetical protein PKC59_14565 [Burkholderiaceae bacterium]|nr:hypothetical protein [Burkholderiaceae bacterium]HMX10400.1 hypothetical protein [Burkholderiaceae bacterium]HMZ00864.1 hypothetical protein [Burkholderiaceae bacterium]HNB45576.1 hypothetical protein [Burkholderiaceae bacterium]HNG80286.1 hypothetical protein [Burkholderiaceae bacterium]